MIPGMHFHSRHDVPFILSVIELVVVIFPRFILKVSFFNLNHDRILAIHLFSNHLLVRKLLYGLVDLSGMN